LLWSPEVFMATTKPPHNGVQATEDLLEVEVFKGDPNTLIVEDESLRYGFIQLPRQLLYARNLSYAAKLLYAVLLGYAWQEGSCFPGYRRLCLDMQANEKTVRRYMRELESIRLLSQKRRGQGKTNIYVLHDLRTVKFTVQEPPNFTVQERQNSPGNNKQNNKETEQYVNVVGQALQNFGISKSAATNLAKNYPEAHILGKLELAQWLVSTGSPLVAKNPAGWLRKAIEEDYAPPRNYQRSRQHQAKGEREAKIAQAEARAASDTARERHMAEEEYRRVKAESKAQLLEQYPPQPVGDEGLTTESVWDLTLKRLKEQVSATTYETWLKDTVLLQVTDQAAQIAVPSTFAIAWLERRLYREICTTIKGVLGKDLDLQFIACS
jgi:DNA-binding transcriptional regulator YhcF (GntR family)